MTQDERERLTRLETRVDYLSDGIQNMSSKVDTMHSIMMQARGARWAIIVMASIGGFAAGIAAKLMPFFKS